MNETLQAKWIQSLLEDHACPEILPGHGPVSLGRKALEAIPRVLVMEVVIK
jgi:hypothetical protein